jgi:NADH-quinone oxidoreductase subunit M
MISILILLPLAALLVLALLPAGRTAWFRWGWLAVAVVELGIVGVMWAGFDPGGGMQFEEKIEWIPMLGVAYQVGVDGISLPLIAMTALLFLACAIYSLAQTQRVKEFAMLFLFLESTSFGVFAALDLIVFYLFWDLTLIAMFLVILVWGHEDRRRASLKFLLYTFVGSLALLLGIIGLYLLSEVRTFDMIALAAENPLAGSGSAGALVLLALSIGFAIKTPTFPVHTWLPPAHVEAPAAGSAILAGVMLKMGTYGFVRIAISIAPEQWRTYAMVAVVIGVISVLYGALVALGQVSFKRLIAYTSVNHMGYIILALGAAAVTGGASPSVQTFSAQTLAVAGAVTQMVAHGLVTGLLFLLTGMLYRRAGAYDFDRFGGLMAVTPILAIVTIVAAVASFGVPGFAHFVAELQIFMGSLATVPLAAILALFGLLITAGLFVWSLQRLFFGTLSAEWLHMRDLDPHEIWTAAILVVSFVAIGLYPRWLLEVITPAAQHVVELLHGMGG